MIDKTNNNEGLFAVNIIDPTDIAFQLISNINIYLGSEGLNFCLLYSKVNGIDAKNSFYELESSTIGRNDQSFLKLTLDIGRAFSQKEKSIILNVKDFGQNIEIHYKSKIDKEKKVFKIWTLDRVYSNKDDTNKDNSHIIKPYEFNLLCFLAINDGKQILILGFKIDNSDNIALEHKITDFIKEIDDALKYTEEYSTRIISDYGNGQSYEIYDHIIQSYKKMLWEGDIENLHLFLFNGYDNRFYYAYTDTMRLNNDALTKYKKYSQIDSSHLTFTNRQLAYITKNIEKTLKKEKLSTIEYNRYKKNALILLGMLSRPDELTKYFSTSESKERIQRENTLKLILSCIPQEPWTGVAGYTSQIRVFDYSNNDSESRWDPHKSDPALFYTRLMVYETLIGVGGKGSVAAFPILDCGQIAGVFFASKPDPGIMAFTKNTLIQLFNLSVALKHFEILKKVDDFKNEVLNKLVQDEHNPFIKVIAEFLPTLFNPILVIVWEQNFMNSGKPNAPSYIYGYARDVEDENDAGLIPLTYKELKVSDPPFKGTEWNHFEQIKKYRTGQILHYDEVEYSLPFKEEYENSISDGPIDGSKSTHKIKSGIVLKYGGENETKTGWLIIYTEETDKILNKHTGFIKHKLDRIQFIEQFEENLAKFLQIKYLSTHDIMGSSIDPLQLQLNQSQDIVTGLLANVKTTQSETTQILSKLLSKLSLSLNFYIPNLIENLSRIDDSTKIKNKYEDIPLIDLIKIVWEDLTTTYFETKKKAGGIFEKVYGTYQKLAKCYFVIPSLNQNATLNNLGFCTNINKTHFELSEIIADDMYYNEFKKILINAPREYLYLIFNNIIKNVYDSNILPLKDIIADETRAHIYVEVRANGQFINIKITDFGIGMTKDISDWVNKIFEYAEHQVAKQIRESDSEFDEYSLKPSRIDPTIRTYYKEKINPNGKAGSKGYGLYSVAFRMNEIHKGFFPKKDQSIKFIKINSDGKNLGTDITLNFKIEHNDKQRK